MCLFITAVVPRGALAGQLPTVATKHRLSFSECDNTHLSAQLRATESYRHATAAYCDCGSPLFFAPRQRSPEREASQIAKLRKKKWSEARIKKWLEATGPRPDDANAPPEGVRSLSQWHTFLHEALQLDDVPYIGVIGHWYGGDVSRESFTLARRDDHSVDELLASPRAVLEWDVLHMFRLGV